ncbi:MAG: hypothetical protein HFJ42_07240 [Clostridia bacterium]|nr:hypothetical protein [Clostridia bacterium]
MKENYPKAYTEVLEIMKYMPKQDVNKIPKEMIEMFENKMDKSYVFNVKETDDFADLKILDETEAIFVNIFRDYWATPEQKKKIIEKQSYDKSIIEKEKMEKYNPNTIFKQPEILKPNMDIVENKKETSLVEVKESLFIKFINFIKNIFKRY